MKKKIIKIKWKNTNPRITILTSKKSWVKDYHSLIVNSLKKFKKKSLKIISNHKKISKSEITFYLGYYKLVKQKYLKKSKLNLVVHESNLPEGRGSSPATWQVLRNKNNFRISIFDIGLDNTVVDSGNIFFKSNIKLNGFELIEEIRDKIIKQYIFLINKVLNAPIIYFGKKQKGKITYFKKRTSNDSKLSINKTINENFSLLRVVDNKRYPAFFKKGNKEFIVKIYPKKNEKD